MNMQHELTTHFAIFLITLFTANAQVLAVDRCEGLFEKVANQPFQMSALNSQDIQRIVKDLANLRIDIDKASWIVRDRLHQDWDRRLRQLPQAQQNLVLRKYQSLLKDQKTETKRLAEEKTRQLTDLTTSRFPGFPLTQKVMEIQKIDSFQFESGRYRNERYKDWDDYEYFGAGIHWGLNERFVLIRANEQDEEVTVVDLQKRQKFRFNGRSRLSVQGNWIAERTAGRDNHSVAVTNLLTQKKYSVEGQMPYGADFFDDLFVGRFHGPRGLFYRATKPSTRQTIELHHGVTIATSGKRFAYVDEDFHLHVLDLATWSEIQHPLIGQSVGSVSQETVNHGLFYGCDADWAYFLDLDTMKVDRVSGKNGKLQKPIPGMKAIDFHPDNQPPPVQGGQLTNTVVGLVGRGKETLVVDRYDTVEYGNGLSTRFSWNERTNKTYLLEKTDKSKNLKTSEISGVFNDADPTGLLFNNADSHSEILDLVNGRRYSNVPIKSYDVVALSPDRRFIYTGDFNDYNYETGRTTKVTDLETHESVDLRTGYMSVSPNGRWMIVEDAEHLELRQIDR